MKNEEVHTVEVHIPSNEVPPQYVVDTVTDAIPIIEHTPSQHGTFERGVDTLTRKILGRVVGVDKGLPLTENGYRAYRTKPIDKDTPLHENYTWKNS